MVAAVATPRMGLRYDFQEKLKRPLHGQRIDSRALVSHANTPAPRLWVSWSEEARLALLFWSSV